MKSLASLSEGGAPKGRREWPLKERHSLSHGLRRASSLKEGAK